LLYLSRCRNVVFAACMSHDVVGVEQNGAVLGTITFWVRLKVPMDQALRLYKASALGCS